MGDTSDMWNQQIMYLRILFSLVLLFSYSQSYAAESVHRDIQSLKQDVLQLNKDLSLLEQELLYPSTQTAVFLSLDVGTPIRLVDINLMLDGKHVGYHFYTEQEFEALKKGGVHRLFESNVAAGKHILQATITGYDPQGRDYQKVAKYQFVKEPKKKFIELRVVDDLDTNTHKFEFKEWNN